jgi:hypothetical protein
MITLVCTKCSTVLNVDDGFAGGVCRCSACGTIQTVPRKGEKPAKAGAGGTVIYERVSREAVNKELEALGEVVTSSGISGTGIFDRSTRTRPVPASRGLWIGIGLGALVAAGGAWLLLRPERDAGGADLPAPSVSAPARPQPSVPQGARIGPISLDRSGTIVYLIDRGDATRPFTASVQAAVARSLATLSPTRRFQVRYWSANGESPAFPLTPSEPSEFNRNKAAAWMDEVIGGQATDPDASLDAALTEKPSEIVLITGKAWQMDESFANQAIAKLSASPVRVHVISLGPKLDSDPLARLAGRTGGTYLALASDELHRLE